MGKRKREKQDRIVLFVLLLLAGLMVPETVVRADMGPKPSIGVQLENPPEEYYYVDLLEQKEYPLDLENGRHDDLIGELEDESLSEADRRIRNMLVEYYKNGWRPRLDGGTVDWNFHPRNEEHYYDFGYMVPYRFRVIVITESGEIYTSEIHEKKFFDAECKYDLKTGRLTEDTKSSFISCLKQVLICYVITLLIEGIILLAFGLARDWRNLLIFFLVNTVTQFLLHLGMGYFGLVNGVDIGYLLCLLGMEVLIEIVEGACYARTLRAKDGKVYTLNNILYAFVANICSCVLGVVIILFLDSLL